MRWTYSVRLQRADLEPEVSGSYKEIDLKSIYIIMEFLSIDVQQEVVGPTNPTSHYSCS